jgi:hypothetical protein
MIHQGDVLLSLKTNAKHNSGVTQPFTGYPLLIVQNRGHLTRLMNGYLHVYLHSSRYEVYEYIIAYGYLM